MNSRVAAAISGMIFPTVGKSKTIHMTTQSKIAVGILTAVTAGVIIGLLIAPEKGSEIRKMLKNKSGDLAHSMGDLFTKAKNRFGKRAMEAGGDIPAY